MKTNYWLAFGMLVSASVLAQPATNPPAAATIEAPAATTGTNTNTPSTAAPAKKKKGKKTEKKAAPAKSPAAELKTVPLVAGPAVVIGSNVNVRGQAKLNSEVVTRLTKGQAVTVVEEIVRNNSGPDEPSAWAKILLPENVHVWVNASFINESNKTVRPKKLNVRAGAGENYSVLGVMKQGDAIKDLGRKGDWMEIEAPPSAYAFMASQYLKQEPAPVVPPIPPVVAATEVPPPTPAPVTEPPTVAPPPKDTPPVTPPATQDTTVVTANPTPVPTPVPETNVPPKEELVPRIVQHEGVVRGTFSIQAPTHFELISPDNGKVINYLYTTSPQLDLRRYKGMHIIVTGEEGLDERWRNTPVITIQKIQVLD